MRGRADSDDMWRCEGEMTWIVIGSDDGI
jgi:hypothetical protein